MGQPNEVRTSFAVPQYNYKLNAFSPEAVMKFTYKHTLIASYICFIIQSIVNNFSPLLFVTYSREFNISLEQIALLVSYNFIVQMVVDMDRRALRRPHRLSPRHHHSARLIVRRYCRTRRVSLSFAALRRTARRDDLLRFGQRLYRGARKSDCRSSPD